MKKIIVDCLSNQLRSALLDNGELVEVIIEDREKNISLGSIYVGRVKKILPSQFAFIDLGDDKNTFLQLNDKKEKAFFEKNGIKQGQDIIVQVIKEASDIKGAVVSTQLSFTGRNVVLLLNNSGVGISQKIDNEAKRAELKALGSALVGDSYGLIMRTNCQYSNKEDIEKEVNSLIALSAEVIEKGRYAMPPYELYKENNETQKMIRDLLSTDVDEIIINDENEYKALVGDMGGKIVLYEGKIPLFHNYYIENQLQKALNKKIWLKSGGFLIIDQTEAMTVIDVNTGKHTGKSFSSTVLKTNMEAVFEIAKLIRLRNLSGMIIIDFIDMKAQEDRTSIFEALTNIVRKDRVKTTVVGMTELGLMQMTRKKMRQPLNKMLLCDCPMCNGSGEIPNKYYIADKIRNEIINIFADTIYNEVVLSANSNVINAFKGVNNEYKIIEEKFGAKIVLKTISTGRYDYYDIEKRRISSK